MIITYAKAINLKFSQVTTGTVFKYEGEHCIKINDDYDLFNVFNLRDNKTYLFNDDRQVQSVECELVIK